jgi:histidinol phosphatase-like PHP family hydrolase
MTPTQFLNECLKEAGEYSHLGYSQIEPYEPELADLIHRLPHDDIILSIAHPNFSFSPVYKRYKMNSSLESRMQCFRERILPVLDDIGIRNYEINAKATPNQVQMIADIVIKRGGYITYGSDNH